MKKIFLIFFLVSLFLPFAQAESAGLVPCGGPKEPACQFCHFFVMLGNIINFLLFYIVPPLAAVMIAIGGFMLIISHTGLAGGPEMISQAKSLFRAIVIGLLIIYGAWLIIDLFFSIIGVKPWFGSWNTICK